MTTAQYIEEILASFDFDGNYTGYSQITARHINSTFALQFEKNGRNKQYIAQMINTNVFKTPVELMENMVNVTNHLAKKIEAAGGNTERETLHAIFAHDGKPYHIMPDGTFWRCVNFITDAYSCNTIENPKVFFNAGAAFGDFMSKLADFPGETLHETIPDFHNTKKRFENFLIALENNKSGRKDNVKEEIDFVIQRKADSEKLVNLIAEGELPIRVTHNDTKINNIMFDNQSNLGLCILDLDTVMPGLSLYDFGDAIRSGAGTAAEDEKDASKMKLDVGLYKAYTEGYLSTAGKSLTDKEAENLAFSAKLLTFECGMRFLTDYLDGDVYFHTDYPEHNLVRCRTQFALVADIEKHMDELNDITAELYRRYSNRI